jgi:hypothetical protein
MGGGKKKGSKPELVHLGFRGSEELTARIDKLAELMGERLGGVRISRSQVLEVLVHQALPLLEYEYMVEAEGFTPKAIAGAIKLMDKEEARILKLRERLPKDK